MINIRNISFCYSGNTSKALDNISLKIEDSEFVLITGPSGCGKSSLCRILNGLIPSFYGGIISGSALVQEMDPLHTPTKEMAKKVGMVFQDPEYQLIATNVEREIAFGLENLGFSKTIIAKRIEEVLDTVGIDHLRNRQISTLSGGEKQKTAIASVLVLHPEVIVLDEPTSELDPKGAEEVIELVKRLNEDFGLTIVLVEHRIDRVLHFVDRLIVMNNNKIIFDGEPIKWVNDYQNNLPNIGLPPIARLSQKFRERNIDTNISFTIKQARENFSNFFKNMKWQIKNETNLEKKGHSKPIIRINNLWFKYPDGPTVLKDINTTISKGEFIAIVGRNAAGKTTFAKIINGLLKPSKGTVSVKGLDTKKTNIENIAKHVGYVFQDPNLHLFADTVEEEITFMMHNLNYSEEQIEKQLEKMTTQFGLEYHQQSYPKSLSTGEKQRVALASVLAAHPEILILDEPTRGLDFELKKNLMKYLMDYRKNGGTIIFISHDIEIIAEFCERVILMSEGRIVADGNKHHVLSNSLHFSPQINRLIQPFTKYGISSDILTVNEIIQGIK